MKGKRTWRWWVTRLELAIGIGLVVLGLGLLFGVVLPSMSQVTFDSRPREWGPATLALLAAGVLGLVAGLVWMVRIFRGPRDEPPPWRYRDR